MLQKVSATDKWLKALARRRPGADGFDVMHRWPRNSVRIAAQEQRPNRVMIVSTSAESRQFGNALAEVHHTRTHEIAEVIERHKIADPDIIWSTEMVLFWRIFYDAEDYVGSPDCTLPCLIIATGWMRNHDIGGAGETLNVTDRLKKVAERWKIPLEFLPSSRL